MRLLQVSLRSSLLYTLAIILLSIPVSVFSLRAILRKKADQSIAIQAEQFLRHIRQFESLGDLETDLVVFDQLSYYIHVTPANRDSLSRNYQTVVLYDSAEKEQKPFRQLSSGVDIKGKPYILTVRMAVVENDDLVMTIALVELTLSVALAVGLLFLNRALSKRLWQPFYKTLHQLKAYELDKSEPVRLEKCDIVEFQDLNKTVSHLTKRNREVFLQQKEFIENASHELQTPIAVLQTKIDELMQSPALSHHQAETIMDLEGIARRMGRLNRNLLLLSKIDNDQYANLDALEISSLITHHLAALKPMAEMGRIGMITDLKPFRLEANRALIEILLTNLFHNAIRYSPNDENILIGLRNGALSVTNKGNPLKMKPSKMMERFSKESADPNSTGLGLAIVKNICDKYGYRIRYTYEAPAHTFQILFAGPDGIT